MKKRHYPGLFLLSMLPTAVMATGILLPKDESLPALAIKYQRVDITIKDGVADTRMEQVFQNNVDRDLEAVYIFPLPADASIADFAMTINGKRVSGELVARDKARRIYEDIVRRMRDPGLLEHLGNQLFRISVYPVPARGEQRIELAYSQTLQYEAGLFRFVYPLRTTERASRTLDDFSARVRLFSSVPIKTIYSPSHDAGITRKTDNEAVIGFEEEQSLLDRDFVLYYGVSEKDIGLNLLAHRTESESGFFMMMLAPTADPALATVIPKDIAFVFDTSGSMAGDKIVQARDALSYCINSLNPEDRFDVIRFSTDVETLNNGLLPASAGARDKALRFVDKLQARGGTDIGGAIQAALKLRRDGTRPYIVAFLTDGLPTVGETSTEEILQDVQDALGGNTRIFVFGVGEKVNAHLLDRISGSAGGASHYVRPDQDIEVEVSSFYNKVSHPVLASPQLTVDRMKIRDLYPKTLPDLFCGGQVTVFGRYEGNGHVAITLSGTVNGAAQELVYEASFPERTVENGFIPRLWATRKVGYLLDEIRLHGEEEELVNEVVRLGKEYGIMTPYTSYLVLEDDDAYAAQNIERTEQGGGFGRLFRDNASRRQAGPTTALGRPPARTLIPMFEAADVAGAAGAGFRGAAAGPQALSSAARKSYLARETGKEAIALSRAIADYKEESRSTAPTAVRYVGKRVFYRLGDTWIDRRYRPEMQTSKLAYGSVEYFACLRKHPELKPCFALGPKVIVCLDGNRAITVE